MYAHQGQPLFNLSPLEMLVFWNVVSISDTSAVNFTVEWWLLACSINSAISILFIIQSKDMSSIYRFHTSG